MEGNMYDYCRSQLSYNFMLFQHMQPLLLDYQLHC